MEDSNELVFEKQEQLAFAIDSTYVNKTTLVTDIKKYTRTQLQQFLQTPIKNRTKLQEISNDLFTSNGLYQKIILYYANLLTFDHYLYPATGTTYKNLMKNMLTASEYLDRLNIKTNCKWIAEEWLKNGELFLYELEDNDGIILKKIPNALCRINRNENGILRYEIDCSKLDDKAILENGLPAEFSELLKDYKAKKAKESKLENNPSLDSDSQWREVGEKGVAFSVSMDSSNAAPVFTTLFESMMAYSDRATKIDDSIEAENLKIVHLKVPTDDKGSPLMDFGVVKVYHDSAKKSLPKGVAISTNPLDMEVFSLKNASSESIADTNLSSACRRVMDEAGVSASLFNGDKVTAEILKQSIIADTSMLAKLVGQLQNWINYKMSTNSKSKRFKMSFVPSTIYDKENYLRNAKDNLAYGGSRLYYLATTGLTPMEALSMLTFEIENKIDEYLIPLQTSYTMSTSSDSEGRKTAEEKGEEVSDSAEKNRGDK